MMQFADPRTDFAFKLIFGNEKAKEVLISFLNAVLGFTGAHAVAEVSILNPYQAPKVSTLKHSFLDVKCRAQNGVEFVVEMQVSYVEGFIKRVRYNACKAYVGQIPSGTDYPKLNQVIGITICDFVMFYDFKHYLSSHELRETVTNVCYLDEIQHFFIELPKFTKTLEELKTTVEKWCYFLKHAGHLEVIPEQLKEEPFLKAFELASRANMTREEWEEYDAAAVRMQDMRGAVTAAVKEAEQKTKEAEQKTKEAELLSRRLLHVLREKGFGKKELSGMTGLSIEEVERLLG